MSACAGLGSPLRNRPAMMRLRSSRHALLPAALRGCGAPRIRCVLDHVAARIAASPPPIGTVLAAGNAIAAAAEAAGGTGAAHAAVGSTLAQVAVTAVAIASGACLSTKVDFLWPRVEQRPDSQILEGVDVTEYPIFKEIKVQKAIAFASKAHLTQFRKTGEPYVTHCIHTGKILAALVPMGGDRAVNTVVAGILHDVIDDTLENFRTIEGEFGDDVAHLVAGVSKLSYINQLLRRHRRESINQNTLSSEEANNLRVMLLGMVDDPRVVLIKLADRLHNMRTIYALSTPKAQAVAQETLAVWCSLASRLGVWALKAELEDLCFAVLQPQTFRMIRAELASMWAPGNKVRQLRKLSTKANLLPHSKDDCTILPENWPVETNEGENMKDLLQAVLPFDLLLDRRKRANFLNNLRKLSESPDGITKGISDSVIALSSLAVCEEALERELHISTSYIPGMEVSLSSRLKSLYSVYSKMRRKGVGIKQIYDARALRVIVGDQNGKLHGPAVKNCYYLLEIVHKLWTPIDGEFDDYIINPKPSGYQSLHTAVQGPDNTPLEVQIRTQRMHEHAEFGLAAHWLYKENKVDHINTSDSAATLSPYQTNISEHEVYTQDESSWKYSAIKTGHPVLRVEGSQLLAAVVVNIDNDGRELLIAVSFLEASEAVADRRSSSQMNRWEIFAKLYKKVSEQWWFAPGHGDWCTCLEKYTLCRDGIFHKQDQFQRLLPTYIQIIDLMEQEEAEYWMVVSALFEGKELVAVPSVSNFDKSTFNSSTSALLDDEVTNKMGNLFTSVNFVNEFERGYNISTMSPLLLRKKRKERRQLGSGGRSEREMRK
ncbi:uncharacterized protein LOC122001615 isoform X2 [Zingiber officinale]|uniref:uncharacterized protein LOC122001614 isoform X2 n=1 Tax=Zingiber officinale TaxID=94328 RepID=UPI001C4CB213|nr:uncharacterized protein LOC122001614 isoform X2 [Zingiber officinale]XP_042412385.1 uncharacterized protein LOC122001615 isoform X2 [Zingiber officinale]